MAEDKKSATLSTGTKVTGPAEVIAKVTGKAKAESEPPKPPTKADLKAEIERRNEGRDEADLIVPESDKNDDLAAALAADDERQS